MVEEMKYSNEEIISLFNKFNYMELECLLNVMSYSKEEYSMYIELGCNVIKTKTPVDIDDVIDIETISYKELLFLYDIISNVEHKLSSVRELVDYDNEIEQLSRMEIFLSNRLNKLQGKKLILGGKNG